MEPLTAEQWKPIDEALFRGRRLPVVLQLRELTGLGLHEVLELMYARYDKLRREQPKKFCCAHEDYWKDFYT